MAFARTRSLNDDPRFLGLLAGVVQDAAGAGDRPRATGGDRAGATGVTPARRPTIAVVGAGIAGLAAAWELVGASDRDGIARRRSCTCSRRATRSAASSDPPSSPDAPSTWPPTPSSARRPEATELCDELGLTDQLVPVGASGASIWARGRLRAMPEGLNLGVPTRWWPLFRSGILSPGRVARAWPGTWSVPIGAGARPSATGRSGDIVGERLGRPVVERLVDPLIGGINAGGVDDLSAAATMPVLIAASQQSGSLMHRLGRVRAAGPPIGVRTGRGGLTGLLVAPGSTASLAEQLADALVRRGVTIQTGLPGRRHRAVDARRAGTGRWTLSLHDVDGDGPTATGHSTARRTRTGERPLEVDGVVLAVPATEAAVLLAPHAPMAAGILSTIEYASVAVVTLCRPAEGSIRAPLRGHRLSGPPHLDHRRPAGPHHRVHLPGPEVAAPGPPGDDLVRVSVGRFGDDRHLGLDDDELTRLGLRRAGPAARHRRGARSTRSSPAGTGPSPSTGSAT